MRRRHRRAAAPSNTAGTGRVASSSSVPASDGDLPILDSVVERQGHALTDTPGGGSTARGSPRDWLCQSCDPRTQALLHPAPGPGELAPRATLTTEGPGQRLSFRRGASSNRSGGTGPLPQVTGGAHTDERRIDPAARVDEGTVGDETHLPCARRHRPAASR
ncbi:hypothetical protein ACRAWD_21795 [Caulobacter segnis]